MYLKYKVNTFNTLMTIKWLQVVSFTDLLALYHNHIVHIF